MVDREHSILISARTMWLKINTLPQPSLPQALPLPKHQVPAQPPAKVCVHATHLQHAEQRGYGILVDPVILTNNGPWETEDELQHIHADSSAEQNSLSADNNNPDIHVHASDNPVKCKHVRKLSVITLTKNLSLLLCSYFMPALVDECSYFIFWLFKGALPCCISQSNSDAPECIPRLFSDQFPGRSPRSIQVFWSSTLKNRAY
ncbi:uncharacterized protein BDW70DRAFT_153871 [Aspergillus foveolatus]|uniref:uncharacterized protein n=1 Tax=Aspergillus foveolatus TaxID=210207 RepID=UPI003CCCDB44